MIQISSKFLTRAVTALFLMSVISVQAQSTPIPVKVVIVSMFEHGEVEGDRPGEFQYWVERLPLDQSLPFPMGEKELRFNKRGVLGLCTGGGVANATASIMALGTDPRFDLSKAYWLVAGIAGGDPTDVSLGSAVWAQYVVDGDLLYEIDAREIPEDWPYGIVPLGGERPAKMGDDIYTGWTVDTIKFELNRDLVNWAFDTSKDISIPSTENVAAFRQQFAGYPNALRDPFVTIGDTLSASTYWHGSLLNGWANDWVKLYSGGAGNFMTSNMEDSGTLTALHRLARSGYVDADRVMVLRTVSNFTMPPPGKSAAWSATAEYPDRGWSSLEAAFLVGNSVVQKLLEGWDDYADKLPSMPVVMELELMEAAPG